MRIRHKGLRALHERDDAARLPAGLVPDELRRILFRLQEAAHPRDADAPGFRLHPLKGDRTGQSERPSFRQLARGVPLRGGRGRGRGPDRLITDRNGALTMNDIANDRVGPMQNDSPHLGELIRESMDDVGWNPVTETRTSRLRARNAVASAERQGGRVGEHGAGAGGYRLGHRRSLDADAGELRACAGPPRPNLRRPEAPAHCTHDRRLAPALPGGTLSRMAPRLRLRTTTGHPVRSDAEQGLRTPDAPRSGTPSGADLEAGANDPRPG